MSPKRKRRTKRVSGIRDIERGQQLVRGLRIMAQLQTGGFWTVAGIAQHCPEWNPRTIRRDMEVFAALGWAVRTDRHTWQATAAAPRVALPASAAAALDHAKPPRFQPGQVVRFVRDIARNRDYGAFAFKGDGGRIVRHVFGETYVVVRENSNAAQEFLATFEIDFIQEPTP